MNLPDYFLSPTTVRSSTMVRNTSVQSQSESFKRPPQTLRGPETLGVNNSYCIPAVRVASSAVPHLNQSGLASQAKVGSWGNVGHQYQNVDHHPILINERATISSFNLVTLE